MPIPNASSCWKVFRQSLPALQLRLAEEKANRLATEHELLINERKNAVRDYYEAYQQTLDPITWSHLPHWSRILDLKTIFRYTHFGECDGTFPSEAVQQDIRIFIEKWIEAGRRHFLQLLPDDVFNDSVEDPLSLACAVFLYPPPREHCLPTTALLGWQDLALHLDCFTPLDLDVVLDGADFTPVISFSQLGHDIVKHLLKTLDLDPNHVLATELVAVKQRFVCTTCPLVRSHGTRGTYVMTIAECVGRYLVPNVFVANESYIKGFPCARKLRRPYTNVILANNRRGIGISTLSRRCLLTCWYAALVLQALPKILQNRRVAP